MKTTFVDPEAGTVVVTRGQCLVFGGEVIDLTEYPDGTWNQCHYGVNESLEDMCGCSNYHLHPYDFRGALDAAIQCISNGEQSIDSVVLGFRGKRKWPKQRGLKYSVWAARVKERDGKCVHCGSSNKLHAHHLKGWDEFPDLRYDLTNGISLCSSCHKKEHQTIWEQEVTE